MATFPLSALVGQQKMRLALILNAIDPLIGGVLIYGRRGTGKSTAVRALADLLPPLTGVVDCPYFCDPSADRWLCERCRTRLMHAERLPLLQRSVPLVTLPLNASEDRVAGSFDLALALERGERQFAPGLLAQANRGILYIDEINLLADHLVDLLLDAAALGIHHVEREGLSLSHPARFMLVGTMNPEEGQLRPQLLERIGLYVGTEDLRDPTVRAALVERRLAYDAAPISFMAQWREAEQSLRERIIYARHLLPSVSLTPYQLQIIAYLVDRVSHAQGHRGDIVVARTACALAAWENRSRVLQSDIEEAALLALAHRSITPGALPYQLSRALERFPGASDTDQPRELARLDEDLDLTRRSDEREGAAGLSRPLRGPDDLPLVESLIKIPRDRLARHEAGRRFLSFSERRSGRSTHSRQLYPVTDIAFSATVRAAAPYQRQRGRLAGGRLELRPVDLRQKVRERKTRALLVFVVDGSDSVMARQLMARTKRLLLALLQQAYEKRDRVALLVFRFAQGRVVLPPTRNFSQARRCVEELTIGGCTPLATGLLEGLRLAEIERLRNPAVRPVLIILTDGLANVDLSGNMRRDSPQRDALVVAREIATRKFPTVLIDTTPYKASDASAQLPCHELARALAADYYQYAPPQDVALLWRGT